ncbi:MAG: hypothetical protein ABTR92_20410 [Candidatus Accumulibacter phosphatis]
MGAVATAAWRGQPFLVATAMLLLHEFDDDHWRIDLTSVRRLASYNRNLVSQQSRLWAHHFESIGESLHGK